MENKITGKSPQPIADADAISFEDNLLAQALCEQVDLLTAEAREGLLYKALTVSNAKCNKLVSDQNARIEELTWQVKNVRLNVNELEWNLKEENESLLKRMKQQAESMQTNIRENVRQLQSLTEQIQAEVSTATAKATEEAANLLTRRIDDAADKATQRITENTEEITGKLKDIGKEIDEAKKDIYYERGFRKFMFWVTPILLLA